MGADIIQIIRHDLMEGDIVRRGVSGPLMIVAISDADIDDLVTCIWIERRRLKSERTRGRDLSLVARP